MKGKKYDFGNIKNAVCLTFKFSQKFQSNHVNQNIKQSWKSTINNG